MKEEKLQILNKLQRDQQRTWEGCSSQQLQYGTLFLWKLFYKPYQALTSLCLMLLTHSGRQVQLIILEV